MAVKRRICVVTGSRADYGLLSWLMRDIAADDTLELQVVVTSMHLSPEFGLSWKQIEADGFTITRKVEMLLSSDSAVGVSKSMGLAQIGLADAFAELQPHVLVLLGDRFETLSAASAGLVAGVPIAHLHGGELTEGAFDDSIRHAVTKMSHLHFTATEAYRRRVIQLGEPPARVFNVGALGLDAVRRLELLDHESLERELGFQMGERNLLVTFHPATLEAEHPARQVQEILDAVNEIKGATVIFSLANADPGGRAINRLIEDYAARNPSRTRAFASLGQLRYLSVLRHSCAVIGNSSSGIIEAPGLGVPTINIGRRQQGRVRAASVIDCPPVRAAIIRALEVAESPAFRERLESMVNPYGDGNASSRIVSELRQWDLDGITMKSFHDLPPS